MRKYRRCDIKRIEITENVKSIAGGKEMVGEEK